MTAVALQSFGFGEQLVRAVDRDGIAWFVGNDVCAALEIGNARDALRRLEDDERDDVGITDVIGRVQQTTVISESGMYALVFTSRKEAAKRFRRWVTQQVLPALRTTGRYEVMPADTVEPVPVLETPDEFDVLRARLQMVREARMAFGLSAARRAWRIVGLPELSERMEQVVLPIGTVANLHRSIGEWMTARTEAAPGHREPSQTLYNDYIGWARAEGFPAGEIVNLTAFGRALTNCGIGSIKSDRVHRIGLKLAA
ncbi:hypothetical protein SAQ01S_07720 [Sphingomonas aquatilis NBRC 16722]|uniref:Prophage antirepressor-like protein n=1 Tax=Sphingomonas aquatilis TaxID=93063 RepID=A0AAW3TQV5_9SPHN|nr:BRO family protein [Sphingomonas aquatilis]MBB3875313.1 prophage antirepressor-like protein [Sphingomonas aquatilis]GEM71006.1 hypothetical protein SAQ01S_07720 [Sphingomonas aquatilis NBRC 16722]